jgi:hypothetical protein
MDLRRVITRRLPPECSTTFIGLGLGPNKNNNGRWRYSGDQNNDSQCCPLNNFSEFYSVHSNRGMGQHLLFSFRLNQLINEKEKYE